MIKVYRFDKDGYFLKDEMVFEDPKNPSRPMLPPDCTEEAPNIEKGYFARYVNGSWINEKIPTTCEEAISMGFTCISNGPKEHNLLKKYLIEALVQSDSEHFKTVVNDNFEMYIEAIPEPTEEELELKQEQANQQEFEQALADLKDRMATADLLGDNEWKAELRAEYQELMEEE